MLTWSSKFPGEEIVYGMDWSKSLADNDTIVSTDVAVSSGCTVTYQGYLGSLQSVKLKGGTPGVRYVLLTAVTSGGETLQEIVRLTVKNPAGA